MLGSGQVAVRPTISGMPVLPPGNIYDAMEEDAAAGEVSPEVSATAALEGLEGQGESDGVFSGSFISAPARMIRAAYTRIGFAIHDGTTTAMIKLQINTAATLLGQGHLKEAQSSYAIAAREIGEIIVGLDARLNAAGITPVERARLLDRKKGHEITLARTLVSLARLAIENRESMGVLEDVERAAKIFARYQSPVELFDAIGLEMRAVASNQDMTESDVQRIMGLRVRMLLAKREAVQAVPGGNRMGLLDIELAALDSAVFALRSYTGALTATHDYLRYIEVMEGCYAMQVQLGNVAYARLHEAIRVGRPSEEIDQKANRALRIFDNLVHDLQFQRMVPAARTPTNMLRRAFASARVGELSRPGQPFDANIMRAAANTSKVFLAASLDVQEAGAVLVSQGMLPSSFPLMRGLFHFQARLAEGALFNLGDLGDPANEVERAGIKVGAATAWRNAGELQLAVDYLKGAAALYKENGQFREAADCSRNAAALFLEIGDPNLKEIAAITARSAIDNYERAFQQKPELRTAYQAELQQAKDLLARAQG